MNCINCDKEIPDDTKFCPYCGAQQAKPVQAEAPAENPVSEETQQMDTQPEEAQQPNVQAEEAQQLNVQPEGTQQPNPGYYQEPVQPNDMYQVPPTQQTPPPVYDIPPVQPGYSQEPPVNWVPYLVLSILSTILCCTPFGIVAIVFAAKINSAVTAGNMAEAKDSAKKAKIWIIVSAAVGVLMWILLIIYIVMIGVSAVYYY